MNAELLKPIVVLVAWTLAMLMWGVVLRLSLSKGGDSSVGKRMVEAGRVLPTKSQYKIDNYNHLLEQPTLFYAVTLTLSILGAHSGLNVLLAWSYVGLRIVHSLVQATTNPVMVRFVVFAFASVPLAWLTINAGLLVFR